MANLATEPMRGIVTLAAGRSVTGWVPMTGIGVDDHATPPVDRAHGTVTMTITTMPTGTDAGWLDEQSE